MDADWVSCPAAWHALPDDVLDTISRCLPPSTLRVLRLVCHDWERAMARRTRGLRPERLDSDMLAARFPGLRWLTLSHCSTSVAARGQGTLRLLSTLRDVDLASVHSLPHLSSLSLYNCTGLTGEGLRHLAPLTRLRQLNLGRCTALQDRHLEVLHSFTQLQCLSLHGCPGVGDEGVALLRGHPTLSVILAPNNIGEVGCEHLVRIPALTRIILHDCPRLSTVGVQTLLAAATIRQVVLSRCPRVELNKLRGFAGRTQVGWRCHPPLHPSPAALFCMQWGG